MSDFVKIIETYNKSRQELKDNLKAHLESYFKDFFEKYPELQGLCWNQYTPAFNDGDPCTFTMNELYFIEAGHDLDEVSDANDAEKLPFGYKGKPSEIYYEYAKEGIDWAKKEIEQYEEACKNPRYEEIYKAVQDTYAFMGSIPEEIFENVFDNGSFVMITKDGIEVGEYDCGY